MHIILGECTTVDSHLCVYLLKACKTHFTILPQLFLYTEMCLLKLLYLMFCSELLFRVTN